VLRGGTCGGGPGQGQAVEAVWLAVECCWRRGHMCGYNGSLAVVYRMRRVDRAVGIWGWWRDKANIQSTRPIATQRVACGRVWLRLILPTSGIEFQIGAASRSIASGRDAGAEFQQAISARKPERQTRDKQAAPEFCCSCIPNCTSIHISIPTLTRPQPTACLGQAVPAPQTRRKRTAGKDSANRPPPPATR
jgi:hypothetical protein